MASPVSPCLCGADAAVDGRATSDGGAHEVAALAAILASGDSSYIAGATIDIDGGFFDLAPAQG